MMKYILKLHVFLVFLTILGCKESTSSKENEISKKEQEVYAEPEFVLDGIYGTSTAIPLSKHHVINVLDGDTETSWKTLEGAGPNEGIMFYFNKPTFIKKINIIQSSGETITTVNQFDVYANGKLYKPESINTSVEAIFIRINKVNTGDVTINTFVTDGVYEAMKGSNTIFSSKKVVAISEIEFIDKSGNKIDFVIPKLLKASIKSSSTLTPEVAYTATNLFDCKKDFGWAENVEGNGIGEFISVKTEEPVEFNKIKIWNGYQRSAKHFNANGSVKKLNFINNENAQVLDLEQVQDPQVYYIENRELSNTFRLTLNEIYEGLKYEDVLMSEIRLYEKNQPIILLSKQTEEVIKANRKEKLSSKVLEYVLDRNMKVNFEESTAVEDTYFNKNKEISFTLRSNNSFVIYKTESQGYKGQEQDFSSQTIADGNWEFISKDETEVKIRIFGRIYDVYNGVDAYKGKQQKESTKIFKDVVTLTMNAIEGEKFIDKIQLR